MKRRQARSSRAGSAKSHDTRRFTQPQTSAQKLPPNKPEPLAMTRPPQRKLATDSHPGRPDVDVLLSASRVAGMGTSMGCSVSAGLAGLSSLLARPPPPFLREEIVHTAFHNPVETLRQVASVDWQHRRTTALATDHFVLATDAPTQRRSLTRPGSDTGFLSEPLARFGRPADRRPATRAGA